MDIDILARQVRDLTEWKAKVEPMLADMMPAWEEHVARRDAPGEAGKGEEEGKAAEGDGDPAARTGAGEAAPADGDPNVQGATADG